MLFSTGVVRLYHYDLSIKKTERKTR
jgi:hypothetical protein